MIRILTNLIVSSGYLPSVLRDAPSSAVQRKASSYGLGHPWGHNPCGLPWVSGVVPPTGGAREPSTAHSRRESWMRGAGYLQRWHELGGVAAWLDPVEGRGSGLILVMDPERRSPVTPVFLHHVKIH